MSTLAHVSLHVSDNDRAKAFYPKVLAPLGVGVVMDGGVACGFGRDGRPDGGA